MRRPFLLLASIVTATIPLRLSAGDLFWDTNGTLPGAGGSTPIGLWDSATANWSTSPDGTIDTQFWDSSQRAVFSAGNTATGTYQITVSGTQSATGVLIEDGTVILSSGTVAVGGDAITVNSGATLSINSSARISGSTLTLNGGTVISTNPTSALAFIPSAMNLEIGPGGGTVNYSPAPGTGTISIYGGATGTIVGTGTLIKTGAGEFRYQGNGLPNTTYTKLEVREGLFRLGFNQSIQDERGFGAVPAVFTPDAITLSGGGSIATSFAAANSVLHVNRGITLGTGGGQLIGPITVPGAITGSGGLTTTSSTVSLGGNNNYTGPTFVNSGILTLGTSTIASGAILNSSGITLNHVTTLSLVNTTDNADRLGNAIPVTLNAGANLSLVHNATTDTTEVIGALTLANGTPILTVSSTTDRITTLTAASLSRGTGNATGLIRGTSLGQTVPTNVARITLADGGTSLNLVGTNTLNNGAVDDATPALKIVPYLFGDTSSSGTGNGFVTYDSTLGFRVLTDSQTTPLTADYVTATNPDNARVSADTTLTSPLPVTLNSLLFKTATTTLNSANAMPLNVASGAIGTVGDFAYNIGSGFTELALGNGEGVVTVSANTMTINTPIRVTNNGGLTKSGAGRLVLGVANNYTGPTTINAGILQVDNAAALGSGPVSINGARLTINGAFTLANAITMGANAGVAGNGLVQAINGTATVSGPITITHNASAGGHFAATGSNTLVVSGPITASPGVTVTSRLGTIILSGGGTGYSAYQIQAGTVKVGAENGIATTAVVDVASSDPATLDLNGFNQILAGIARTSNTADRHAIVTNSGAASTLTLDVSGAVAFGGTTAVGSTIAANAVITGAISLVKTGPGIQSFDGMGANTYTGSTTVNGGILRLLKAANTDAIPAGNGVAINTGGVLEIGANSQINDNITNLSINGGTLNLETFIEGVTPAVTMTNATISGSASTGFLLARGGFVGSGTNTITKSISVRGDDANSGLFNITTGVTTVSGNIRTDDGSIQGVTKSGAGTLVLSGTNSYFGSTTVQAGTLIVSGSLTGSTVTVGDPGNAAISALFGGSGTVGEITATGSGNPATSGATVDPGNAPNVAGILNTGSLSITAGAHLSLQIGGTIAGGESESGYDQLIALGLVTLTGGNLKLTLQGSPTFAANDILYLIVNNGGAAVTGTFSTLNGNPFDPLNITLAGRQFQLVYNANFTGENSDNFANDVALVAVPEPSTWMALLGGLGVIGSMRRRRSPR